jgi:hypothetical protein
VNQTAAKPADVGTGVVCASFADDPTLLQEIARWGVKHCPVCDALERPIPVTTEVSTS